MAEIKIQYRFLFSDNRERSYDVVLDTDTLGLVGGDESGLSDHLRQWIKLDNKKCSHCPLQSANHPNCPIAKNLALVVDEFKDEKSYNKVSVEVVTKERTYKREVPLQEGLHGIFGLIMATSGCPHMNFLKPMARFHLPFSSLEETMVRSISFYLLRQFFIAKKGGQPDFALTGLEKSYGAVQSVNAGIIARIRTLAKGDADMNSVVALDSYGQMLSMQVSDGLSDIEKLFPAVLVDKT